MKKRFYEEPEIEVKTYSPTNIIRTSSGDLGVEDSPTSEGGSGGNGDFEYDEWGGIY